MARESIPDRLDLKHLVDLYPEGKGFDQHIPKVDLALSDFAEVQKKVSTLVEEGYERYRKCKIEDSGFVDHLSDGRWIKYIPLVVESVSDSRPFTFVLCKTFDNAGNVKLIGNLALDEWDSSGNLEYNLLRVRVSEVAQFHLSDKKGDWALDDRYVNPKYRGQKIGKLILDAAETFLQKAADERGETVCEASCAQLDVICWLWNAGYRPATVADEERMEKVLSADSSLCLEDRLYIFKKNMPISQRYRDQQFVNYNKAFRIKFVKKFEPKIATAEVQAKVKGVLGE